MHIRTQFCFCPCHLMATPLLPLRSLSHSHSLSPSYSYSHSFTLVFTHQSHLLGSSFTTNPVGVAAALALCALSYTPPRIRSPSQSSIESTLPQTFACYFPPHRRLPVSNCIVQPLCSPSTPVHLGLPFPLVERELVDKI